MIELSNLSSSPTLRNIRESLYDNNYSTAYEWFCSILNQNTFQHTNVDIQEACNHFCQLREQLFDQQEIDKIYQTILKYLALVPQYQLSLEKRISYLIDYAQLVLKNNPKSMDHSLESMKFFSEAKTLAKQHHQPNVSISAPILHFITNYLISLLYKDSSEFIYYFQVNIPKILAIFPEDEKEKIVTQLVDQMIPYINKIPNQTERNIFNEIVSPIRFQKFHIIREFSQFKMKINIDSHSSIQKVREYQRHKGEEFNYFFKNKILLKAFAIMGRKPRCEYVIFSMGSNAREELCEKSDLEWGILISNGKEKAYFETLAKSIKLLLLSEGITIDPTEVIIGTPQDFSKLSKMKFSTDKKSFPPIEYSLLKTRPIAVNQNCSLLNKFPLYQISKENLRIIIKHRLDDFNEIFKYPPEQKSFHDIDLKKEYIQPLFYLLQDISLLFGIKKNNTLDIIDELKNHNFFCQNSNSYYLFKYCIAKIYVQRVCNTIDKRFLYCTYWMLIKPLYQLISSHQNLTFNSFFKIAFRNIFELKIPQHKKYALEAFVYSLYISRVSKVVYIHYYQELSFRKNSEQFRSIYMNVIESLRGDENLKRTLYHIPNVYGFRLSDQLARKNLRKNIQKITVRTPEVGKEGFSILIEGPAVNRRYLRCEVIDQIIAPDGDIKKHPQKQCLHNVHRGIYREDYDFHFKQMPDHPGLEQAVSRFMMRVIGHGTSFSELVKFTVFELGKEVKKYLVLISETIPGNNLNEIEDQSLKHLDKKRFTNLLLLSPLVLPGDNRGPNMNVEAVKNEDGKQITQITSFDNDVAFVNPVVTENSWNMETIKIQLHNILFFLDTHKTLDKEAIIEFLKLRPGPLILDWLDDLIKYNQECEPYFKEFEQLPNYTPFVMFEKGAILQLIAQFYELQRFLDENKNRMINREEILSSIICFNQNKIDVGEKILNAYKKAESLSGSPTTKVCHVTDRKTHESLAIGESTAVMFRDLPKTNQQKGDYLPEKAKDEVDKFLMIYYKNGLLFHSRKALPSNLDGGFKNIVKDGKPDISTQFVILRALVKHNYENLNLSYCQALTNQGIRKFTKISREELITLNLRGCHQLTSEVLLDISMNCPNLKELYLSKCKGIEFFSDELLLKRKAISFQKLEVLHLDYCPNLTSLRLIAPKLKELKLNYSTQLKIFELKSYISLKNIEVLGCPKIPLNMIVNGVLIETRNFKTPSGIYDNHYNYIKRHGQKILTLTLKNYQSNELFNLKGLLGFCHNLKELHIDGSTSLNFSPSHLNLPMLEVLILENCPNLSTLSLISPRLISLKIKNCPNLTYLNCKTSMMVNYQIENCPKLNKKCIPRSMTRKIDIKNQKLIQYVMNTIQMKWGDPNDWDDNNQPIGAELFKHIWNQNEVHEITDDELCIDGNFYKNGTNALLFNSLIFLSEKIPKLKIMNCRIDEAFTKNLEYLIPYIESLYLYKNVITKEGLEGIKKIYKNNWTPLKKIRERRNNGIDKLDIKILRNRYYRRSTLNVSYHDKQLLKQSQIIEYIRENGKEITELDFSGNPIVTSELLVEIENYCPNLRELNLSSCKGIEHFEKRIYSTRQKLIFPYLEKLDVSNCVNLGPMKFEARRLKELHAQNCRKLVIEEILITFFTRVNLENTPKENDEKIKKMILSLEIPKNTSCLKVISRACQIEYCDTEVWKPIGIEIIEQCKNHPPFPVDVGFKITYVMSKNRKMILENVLPSITKQYDNLFFELAKLTEEDLEMILPFMRYLKFLSLKNSQLEDDALRMIERYIRDIQPLNFSIDLRENHFSEGAKDSLIDTCQSHGIELKI